MGKRSAFELKPKDFYPTIDPNAVIPLVPFVRGLKYAEVCYGSGDLEDLLMDVATCVWRSDAVKRDNIGCIEKDARDIDEFDLLDADCIITNPPYTWNVFSEILDNLLQLDIPIWLLLPADWMHNIRMGPYFKHCKAIVSIGRLYWEDNKIRGKDNYCWYKFVDNESSLVKGPVFIPREVKCH